MRRLAALPVAVIILAAFLPVLNAEACTRMFWNTPGKVMLVGRNYDLPANERPIFYVFPEGIPKNGGAEENPHQWTSRYGSLVVTAFGSSQYAYEGINTAGLAFHALSLLGSQYETRDVRRPGVLQLRFGEYLLDRAASVSEALKLMHEIQLVPEVPYLGDGLNLHGEANLHYALEDATGDAAIIEFVDGRMNVYHGPQYTTLTNDPPLPQMPQLSEYRYFGGTRPLPGDIDPESRFVRASAFLFALDTAYKNPDPNFPKPTPVAAMFSATRSIAEPFGVKMLYEGQMIPGWPTLWTAVSDLTNRRVYFSHALGRNNFWVDMKKLDFRQGAPVRRLEAYRPGLAKEVSGLFRPR